MSGFVLEAVEFGRLSPILHMPLDLWRVGTRTPTFPFVFCVAVCVFIFFPFPLLARGEMSQ